MIEESKKWKLAKTTNLVAQTNFFTAQKIKIIINKSVQPTNNFDKRLKANRIYKRERERV